jgi:hypothetical protein
VYQLLDDKLLNELLVPLSFHRATRGRGYISQRQEAEDHAA